MRALLIMLSVSCVPLATVSFAHGLKTLFCSAPCLDSKRLNQYRQRVSNCVLRMLDSCALLPHAHSLPSKSPINRQEEASRSEASHSPADYGSMPASSALEEELDYL